MTLFDRGRHNATPAVPPPTEIILSEIREIASRTEKLQNAIREIADRTEDLQSRGDDRTRHIFHYLYDVAKKESADFIYQNLHSAVLLHSHLDLLEYALKKASAGDVIEFGVFQATSTNHIAKVIAPAKIYGFDSFQGLREDWVGHVALAGGFDLNSQLPEVEENVTLVPGWVQDTLPPFLADRPKKSVAFVHFDLDTYESSKYALATVAPWLADRAIFVFDEYHSFPGWKVGEKLAFEEWLPTSGYAAKFIGFSWEQAAVEVTRIQ
ncbi:class I SAM-dependent methyltransferase [Novosphingobium sp. RD2P27]|uniref:Class I SAM-dependent methyltransferase n=1 Tax=Novosphingobium kalidii TaxID=3230299 RepID=A0ABV2D0H8_9SPHN